MITLTLLVIKAPAFRPRLTCTPTTWCKTSYQPPHGGYMDHQGGDPKKKDLAAFASKPLISNMYFGGLGRNRTTDTRIFNTRLTYYHFNTNYKKCNTFSWFWVLHFPTHRTYCRTLPTYHHEWSYHLSMCINGIGLPASEPHRYRSHSRRPRAARADGLPARVVAPIACYALGC